MADDSTGDRLGDAPRGGSPRPASRDTSEARYRTVVETQSEFVVRWLPRGSLTFVNEAYCRALGRTRDELLGQSFLSHIHAEDQGLVRARIQSLSAAAPETQDVRRVVLADGEIAWHEWSHRGIYREGGPLVELQSVGRDVTRRRRAEEQLRVSEERYRLLAEHVSDVICTLDLRRRFVYVSPSVERVLGYRPAELTGRSLDELLFSEQDLALPFSELQVGGDPVTIDLRLRARPDREVWTEARVTRLPGSESDAASYLAVVRDITAWRATQEALRESEDHLRRNEKLNAIGRLAGGVAHDFNNILTVILGNVDLIESQLDAAHGLRPCVLEIGEAARRASSLTRQLLAFGRRQRLEPKVLQLEEVVLELEMMLRRLLGEHIGLDLEIEADLPPIRADRGQLEQVLVNLLVNAKDSMPEGGRATIRVHSVEVGRSRIEGRGVRLAVMDTGVGIAEEHLERIFEPFFTTKEAGRGTGLGLPTVYGIVTQSGGRVHVRRRVGGGTSFEVDLPSVSAPVDPVEETGAVAIQPRGRESVLVVEDEPAVREAMARTLREHGYLVLEAGSAVEALACLDDVEPAIDLVVTDIVMPGLSGLGLAELVGQRVPSARVLFISGQTEEALARHGGRPEGRAFLEKPFSGSRLLQTVGELLARENDPAI